MGPASIWSVLPPGPQASAATQGAILKAPLGGGAITTLASFTPFNFGSILVDDTSVYWSNTPDSSVASVQITKADKNGGGTPVVLATSLGVNGMAIDSTSIYWGAEGAGGSTLVKVDKMGGSPVTLATEQSQVFGPAVDSTYAYYARGGSASINGVSQGPDGAIVSVPLVGGTQRTLVSMHGVTPFSIAVQGNYVYYTTEPYPPGPSRAGTLMRVPVGYGTPTKLASESDVIDAVVVDSANVYWGGFAIGLKSMPLAGGTPTEPAPCQFPVGIAVSGFEPLLGQQPGCEPARRLGDAPDAEVSRYFFGGVQPSGALVNLSVIRSLSPMAMYFVACPCRRARSVGGSAHTPSG